MCQQNSKALLRCVADDSLKATAAQEACFGLLIVIKGTMECACDAQSFKVTAPCFVTFHEDCEPLFVSQNGVKCHSVYFHPTFLNAGMTFENLRSDIYGASEEHRDGFLLQPFLDGPRVIPIAEKHLSRVVSIFDDLERELRDNRYPARIRTGFLELLIVLERMYGLSGYGDPIKDCHIVKMVTMWKNGQVDLPHYDCRIALYGMDFRNADTRILLHWTKGYQTRSLEELTLPPRKHSIPPDAAEEYAALLSEMDTHFQAADTMENWEDGFLQRLSQAMEDHETYFSGEKRYMSFLALVTLLSPYTCHWYYRFLYHMLHCAEMAEDADALVEIYTNLETYYSPLHLQLMEGAALKLEARGKREHAARLQEMLAQRQSANARLKKYHNESTVVDVVFEMPTKRCMGLEEERNGGTFPHVYCVDDGLDHGNIDFCHGDGVRLAHYERVLTVLGEGEQERECAMELVQEFERDFAEMLAMARAGRSVRIWRSQTAAAACGMAFVCDALRDMDCEITVVTPPQDTAWFGQMTSARLPFCVQHEKRLSAEEVRCQSDLWRRLQCENTALRAVVDGSLQSVPEEYYDGLIRSHIPNGRDFVLAEVIGKVQYEARIGDYWPWYRLCRMIENGELTLVKGKGEPDSGYSDTVVRKTI